MRAGHGRWRLLFGLILCVVSLAVLSAAWADTRLPVAASIPYRHDGFSVVGTLVKSAIFLLVIGMLLIAALYFVRKYFPAFAGASPMGTQQHLKVLEVRRLTPKSTLFLVELDGKRILLGQGEGLQVLSGNVGPETSGDPGSS